MAPAENVERDEKRIAVLRTAMATVDGKEAVLKQVSTELAEREKGLIPGDTAEQAQAQLLQIMRRLAKAQAPPLDIRQFELGQPRSYGESYARVTVSVSLDCRIDESGESAGGVKRATGDHRHRRDPLHGGESEIEIHAGTVDRLRSGAAPAGSGKEGNAHAVTRKLMLLDLALAAGVLLPGIGRCAASGWKPTRARRRFCRLRSRRYRRRPWPPLPRVAPLAAVAYAEVAQLNLFSKDRNPQVIIDPVEPPKAKPIPAFPVARGVLLWEARRRWWC